MVYNRVILNKALIKYINLTISMYFCIKVYLQCDPYISDK